MKKTFLWILHLLINKKHNEKKGRQDIQKKKKQTLGVDKFGP